MTGLESDIESIAIGGSHACALTTLGGIQCWGSDLYGQLGRGILTGTSGTPADVIGLTDRVAAVAAGGNHTCALMTSSGLRCWGSNDYGELGTGNTVALATPTGVIGLASGVAAVVAGAVVTCALTNAGALQCWGQNLAGQLGTGTTSGSFEPIDVTGLARGVAEVAVGGKHTCALHTTGALQCWGYNAEGQLGTGTPSSSPIPVQVTGLTSDIVRVAAGYVHTCALTTAGGLQCWGQNAYGQLGDGTFKNSSTPVDVTGLASGVVAVALGRGHTCALTTASGLKCWGDNFSGQLGDGTFRGSSTPVDVMELGSGVAAVVAGSRHTCVLTTRAGMLCWGNNDNRQLGNGTRTKSPTQIAIDGLANGVAAVAAGGNHTCALTTEGGVQCWGSGQLGGMGALSDGLIPGGVKGLSSGVADITGGGVHTCALTVAPSVQCWGYNTYGELGDGKTRHRPTPGDVTGLSDAVTAVSAGGNHTCALTTLGSVQCWGYNGLGQLGDGTTTDRSSPVDVRGLSSRAVEFTAGGDHTCAVNTGGGVECWGDNRFGQLGDGVSLADIPAEVIGFSSGVASVATGFRHTCVLTTMGGVQCWGNNASGQLGNGVPLPEAKGWGIRVWPALFAALLLYALALAVRRRSRR